MPPPPDQLGFLRGLTVTLLSQAATLAGANVQEEGIDENPAGTMPALVVMADQTAEGVSPAGTELRLHVTANLVIHAIVQRAKQPDAVRDLDVLVRQVKEALFCNPLWISQVEPVSSLRVVYAYRSAGEGFIGDARIVIAATWFETYDPVLGPGLQTVAGTLIPPGNHPPNVTFSFRTA